jgi:hypothetical protein
MLTLPAPTELLQSEVEFSFAVPHCSGSAPIGHDFFLLRNRVTVVPLVSSGSHGLQLGFAVAHLGVVDYFLPSGVLHKRRIPTVHSLPVLGTNFKSFVVVPLRREHSVVGREPVILLTYRTTSAQKQASPDH